MMEEKLKVASAAVTELWNHLQGKASERKRLVVGLGSGSTAEAFWNCFKNHELTKRHEGHIIVIPTSYQSRELVQGSGESFILGDLAQFHSIDTLVDGFDRMDQHGAMIKGGGGAHTQEKLVALKSAYNIYIGTKDKLCDRVGSKDESVPVEVLPAASQHLLDRLGSMDGTDCRIRACKGGKMWPIISDNGNFIADWSIPAENELWKDLDALDQRICGITGVLGSGLFVGLANCVITVDADGRVERKYFERK